MKIGLVGGTVQQFSLPFDAQRTINFYPILDETGKEVASMLGSPGLSLFGNMGTGVMRGEFASAKGGRAFAVCGSGFYEVDAAGNGTLRGSLLQSNGIVYMAENAIQLAVCDGTNLYMFTYSTNTFAKVADTDLPASVGSVTYLDSFFIVNQNGTGRFYISAPNDGTSWDPLDFANAESSPDGLLRPISAIGQLWLLGSLTCEIWTNTGAAAFPFKKISGGKMNMGILAPASAVELDNTLFWVGQNSDGSGMVVRANGFIPKVISTEPITLAIKKATDPTNIRGYSYQDANHVFYVLTGGGLETTLVYDVTTGIWHEKAYLNDQGALEQHLGCCYMTAFGRHLVGDRTNGNIYVMDSEIFSDNGRTLPAIRRYTHLSDESKRVRYNQLIIGVESGVGLQFGQGQNPVGELRLSKDGARTWSDIYTAEMGKVGEYKRRIAFRRLGVAETMTFEFRINDPVKRAVTGSYLT